MATYNFSTITAAQAQGFTAADTLLVEQGSASATTVLFIPGTLGAGDTISLTVGTRTVVFAPGVAGAAKTYADGSKLFIGSQGNDAPGAFGAEANGLYGGAGDDTLSGGGGMNLLQGNQGNDSLVGGTGFDVIYGGQDSDFIVTGGGSGLGSGFGQGNKGDDTVNGAALDNDTLLGGQGNDVIGAINRGPPSTSDGLTFYLRPSGLTGGGNDVLNGNLGDDSIYAARGDDLIFGEDGNDLVMDTGGRNTIDGGAGDDVIVASGQSTISGGSGDDGVFIDEGTFVVNLGDGNDYCSTLFYTPSDRATVDGGAGNDFIRTADGSDSLNGGAGDDELDGSAGRDILAGGSGLDEFEFYGGESGTVLALLDDIIDWSVADDVLYFENLDTGDSPGFANFTTYFETTAATYAAALSLANSQIAGGTVDYVAVQVGSDVYVFADSLVDNGDADTAVRLVGRTLDDISQFNFTL